MKLINDLLDWSFLAASFIIYILTQFILGLLFVGDSWQVTSGPRYRIKKLLEFGIPTIIGMLAGYFIVIPCPVAIMIDPIARCLYFGFAGGASPLIHTAVEAAFPSVSAKMTDVIKAWIGSPAASPNTTVSTTQTNTQTETSTSTSHPVTPEHHDTTKKSE